MPAIHHSHLREHLDTVKNGAFAPVYLVYGEEMLYKRALERLLAALLPGEAGHLNYDPLDGTDAQVAEALERVNTFSLLAGTKVIGLLDSTVFYSRVDPADFLKKSRTAHQRGDFKRAAVHLLTLLSRKDFALEDIDADNRLKTLGSAAPETGEDRWLDEVIDYCRKTVWAFRHDRTRQSYCSWAWRKGFQKTTTWSSLPTGSTVARGFTKRLKPMAW